METSRNGFAAQHGQIRTQHNEHRERHDGFGRRELKDLQVVPRVHWATPFASKRPNIESGEVKQGSIQFIRRPGKRPMTSDAPMSITAPKRSGMEIGSIG